MLYVIESQGPSGDWVALRSLSSKEDAISQALSLARSGNPEWREKTRVIKVEEVIHDDKAYSNFYAQAIKRAINDLEIALNNDRPKEAIYHWEWITGSSLFHAGLDVTGAAIRKQLLETHPMREKLKIVDEGLKTRKVRRKEQRTRIAREQKMYGKGRRNV